MSQEKRVALRQTAIACVIAGLIAVTVDTPVAHAFGAGITDNADLARMNGNKVESASKPSGGFTLNPFKIVGNLAKGIVHTANGIAQNVPILGGIMEKTGAGMAIDKALGGKGYMTMPSDWAKFTIDAKTTTIQRVLKGNAFLNAKGGDGRLDIMVNKGINANSLTYGVSTDGFVAIEENSTKGPKFFYDSKTGMMMMPAGIFRLKKKEFRTLLDSVAQHPAEWAKYAKSKSCADEDVVRPFLTGIPSTAPAAVLGEDVGLCDEVSGQVNVITATLWEAIYDSQANWNKDGSHLDKAYIGDYFQIIVDHHTQTGKAIAKVIEDYNDGANINDKKASNYANAEAVVADLKKFRDPELQKAVVAAIKVLPPESEIIQLVDTVFTAQEYTGKKVANGANGLVRMDLSMNIDVMRTIHWNAEVPAWKPGKDLRGFEFADWAGWMMFTEDGLVNTLKHFDFGPAALVPADTTNVQFSNKVAKGKGLLWLESDYVEPPETNGNATNNKENIPVHMPVDLSVNARSNWYKFVQSLTADELRKLVVAASNGAYRTDALVSEDRYVGNPEHRDDRILFGSGNHGPDFQPWSDTHTWLNYTFGYNTYNSDEDSKIWAEAGKNFDSANDDDDTRSRNSRKSKKIRSKRRNDWVEFLDKEGVKLTNLKIPHSMGLLAVRVLCPENPLAINVPAFWGVNGPGLTLNRYLTLSLLNRKVEDYDKSTGLAIVKKVDVGDIAGAKTLLNATISNVKLKELKKIAVEREPAAREAYSAVYERAPKAADDSGFRTANAHWSTDIKLNPTAEYRILLDKLFPAQEMSAQANDETPAGKSAVKKNKGLAPAPVVQF